MTTIETKIAQAEALLAELRAILSGPKVEQPQAPSAEPAAYCITKGQPPITDHALVVAASKRQADRIDELEARVKELEANAKTLATANYENQVELQEQLTASRAQVDRLVEAAQNLRKVKGRYHTEQAFNALMEALAAVEKELNNGRNEAPAAPLAAGRLD